jgi:hypothetical protein
LRAGGARARLRWSGGSGAWVGVRRGGHALKGEPLHYVLIGFAVLALLWLGLKYLVPAILRQEDFVERAASLDREGAHEMLDGHLRYMAMAIALPGHFYSGERDVKAATAAMMRIMEIEGEPPDAAVARDFVVNLADRRAEEMKKGEGQYPIIFDDMWPL